MSYFNKKIFSFLLAAFIMVSIVLSLPSDTYKSSDNVITAMAINNSSSNGEIKYPLQYAVCTKEMNLRAKPSSKSEKKGTLKKGTLIFIHLYSAKVKNVNGNIWIKDFYINDQNFRERVTEKKIQYWVCISNSNVKVPTHFNRSRATTIYSQPNTKSNVLIQLKYVVPLYVTNIPRINNDNWGLVSYYDIGKKKTYTGYILVSTLDEMHFNLKQYDYLWVDSYNSEKLK